jgi:RimJ/RimL family protein N-acetyltransferase
MTMSAEWQTAFGKLVVREPERGEIEAASQRLASFYNDPHNRSMLDHSEELSAADVREHYDTLWAEGGVPLWLECDGALVGDADLRHVQGGVAETAILVGERAIQGRGLGTRFNLLVHALAFRGLGLRRVYATILAANQASQRIFTKLGYEPDHSAEARAYIDEDSDLTFSLGREQFEALHGPALGELVLRVAR